jgi:peptidoglycan/LPS O-acetylase OafA/YrhL
VQAGPSGQDIQLDGLRTFAVGAVLYAHFLVEETLAGHMGVRLFFALSGFLITRILLTVRASNEFRIGPALGSFYARRILRIFPAFYILLLISFLLGAVNELGTWKWFATYFSNFLYAFRGEWNPWMLGHTWTLSIEEQFYAVWPLMVFLTPKSRLRLLCWIAIGVSVAFRFYFPITLEPTLARDLLPPASMDALALGSLLAVHMVEGSRPFGGRLRLIALTCLALLIPAWLIVPGSPPAEWLRWFALEILILPVFIFIIDAAVTGIGGPVGKLLANRQMRFIGRISYGIYLYHFLILWIMLEFAPELPGIAESGVVRFVVCGGLTIAMAIASWFLLERPINDYKSHFPYLGKNQPA